MNNQIRHIKFDIEQLPFLYRTILTYYKNNLSEDTVIAGGFARAIGHFLLNINKEDYLYKKGDIDFFNLSTSKAVNDDYFLKSFYEEFDHDFKSLLYNKIKTNSYNSSLTDINYFNSQIKKFYFNRSRHTSTFSVNYYYNISNCFYDFYLDEDYKNNNIDSELSTILSNIIKGESLSIKFQNIVNKNFIFNNHIDIFQNFDFSNSCWCIEYNNNKFTLLYTNQAYENDINNILSINKEDHNQYLPMRIKKYIKSRNCEKGLDKKSIDLLNNFILKAVTDNWYDFDSEEMFKFIDRNIMSFNVIEALNKLNLLNNKQLSLFINRWSINVREDFENYKYSFNNTDFASWHIKNNCKIKNRLI